MKVSAIVTAYNEELFLDYCLKSIYDFVDEIIITDCAIQATVDLGYPAQSFDGTSKIIDKYLDDKKVFVTSVPKVLPKSHKELIQPAFDLARQHNATWMFRVPADEVWTKETLAPMKSILKRCDAAGIMGLNVWQNIFGPDFWNVKDFRNPRFSRITEDAVLTSDDAVAWTSKRLWQYAGNTVEPFPPGTPLEVQKVNSDYPKMLKGFHYSCVGRSRVQFKADFFKKYNGTWGDRYNEAYLTGNFQKFREFGYRPFTGKHPDIMRDHPLYNERLL